jgi:hypothetical protein
MQIMNKFHTIHTLTKVFGRPKKESNGRKLENTPSPAEWCSAVAPKSLGIAGLAPRSRRYLAVSVCPCRAAWIRGVSPIDKQQQSIDNPKHHYQ